MAVEMVSEHRRRFFGSGGTVFDRNRHVLVECDWLNSARRATNRQDLLLYRHTRTGAWVVAVWAQKPDSLGRGGYMVELDEMYEHPDKWMGAKDRALRFSYLRARLRPVGDQQKEMDRKAAAAWARECFENESSNRQREELIAYLGRKGPKFEHLRKLMQTGEAEYVGDDEGGKMLKDMKAGLKELL